VAPDKCLPCARHGPDALHPKTSRLRETGHLFSCRVRAKISVLLENHPGQLLSKNLTTSGLDGVGKAVCLKPDIER